MAGKLRRERKLERDEEADVMEAGLSATELESGLASAGFGDCVADDVDSRLEPRCDADGMNGNSSARASARDHAVHEQERKKKKKTERRWRND